MKRYLGGSDVGFAIPGAGVFVGENLTPDKETGLGAWTDTQIIAAIRSGQTPDGRQLSPVMPYPALAHLTDEDAQAIVAFLKSLPQISNKVKNFAPNEKVTVNVSAVLPPAVYNALPAPRWDQTLTQPPCFEARTQKPSCLISCSSRSLASGLHPPVRQPGRRTRSQAEVTAERQTVFVNRYFFACMAL